MEEILRIEKQLLDKFIESNLINIEIQKHWGDGKYEKAQEWFNVFQGQHVGLKTRLLDWTQKYDVALFFSVLGDHALDKDGVVWVYKCPRKLLLNFNNEENRTFFNTSPFEHKVGIIVKHPTFFEEQYGEYVGEVRRARQMGSFFIPTNDLINTPLEEISYIKDHLIKINITSEFKKTLKKRFEELDFNNYLLYRTDETVDDSISELNSRFLK